MESPAIQEGIRNQRSSTRERILGALTLCLIFTAGASFSWTYLTDVEQPLPEAQVAAAEIPQQKHLTTEVFSDISLKAKSAIMVDETTDTVLYELNPDVQLPLASLTKVPLVLVVKEALAADTIITMPRGMAQFSAGTRWKLADIIDFTLAISSNQGANVLAATANDAIHAAFPDAPKDTATLWRMNELARELGLDHTYFLNANGLDDSPTQSGTYGSARDMATLFAYAAATTPGTFAATTRQSFLIESVDGARATAINTDEALPSIPGMVMGKTGYTDLAGGNLAVVFNESGHRIVAVVLGSTQTGRFDDMKKLVALSPEAIAQEK